MKSPGRPVKWIDASFMRKAVALLSLLVIFLHPDSSLSERSGHKVLVVSSDEAVEKYLIAREEFKKSIPGLVQEINLSAQNRSGSNLRKLIADADPDLIYCIGSKAYLEVSKHAGGRKIVFSSIINWLRLPVTRNTYGISSELDGGMQVMLFRYVFPAIKKIGVLYSKDFTSQWFNKIRRDAEKLQVEIVGRPVTDSKDAVEALKKLLPSIDAFLVIPDPLVLSDQNDLLRMLDECDALKKPVFSYHDGFVRHGAVLVVSADGRTIGRQAADIAARLLEGQRIDDKVQYPAGSNITLNLKKAKAYGLQYSEDAIGSVNSIVEY